MVELTAIKEGKTPAFTRLHQLYQKKLFRFFLKRTGSQDAASELAQQAFVKLWASRHTLSAAHSIETQVFTIAGSVLIDWHRRRAHERDRHAELSVDLEEMPAETVAAGRFEHSDYLNVLARGLPPARKRVFLLKMGSGFTNKEIASQLAISEKTVEDHVSKALRYIRSIVALLLLFFH